RERRRGAGGGGLPARARGRRLAVRGGHAAEAERGPGPGAAVGRAAGGGGARGEGPGGGAPGGGARGVPGAPGAGGGGVRTMLAVAADLIREATKRKWFLGLAIAITAVLVTLSLSLRMDVVDGALAATRLFGKLTRGPIQSVDVALRPVFMAVAAVVFYGGSVFGIIACADFAPTLLSPGRIEHLLALPVRRWQLLAGTFLGVLALSLAAALYGSGGL